MLCQRCSESAATGFSSIAWRIVSRPTFMWAHAGRYAKFWLDSVTLASSRGFSSHELTTIRQLVEENRELFLEKWNAYFSGKR